MLDWSPVIESRPSTVVRSQKHWTTLKNTTASVQSNTKIKHTCLGAQDTYQSADLLLLQRKATKSSCNIPKHPDILNVQMQLCLSL